ncbi:acetyl-CoA carboxylase, biotin carboxyl carrier protein [Syntrophobotulus glycolicus DSM 8271]|uniref:Biotin carboxyl carrier protein of acetyl-CoA carboxylase n=1 Tax=Syntrophobotulus glycolicus (strain DSM 8271 / FlGlyR) TaxID=645991 RepID=F0T0C8_SYNGF|nr:acetyl-CoA carboxylase biotin carboxyl carrier protein [Syntrophobotulus glycolicus]ADY57300.1 acetyl-CoA carboxylase, biotin carboxyl carrier protein [Syntrophobotulus glycolicus DSM 8271]
MELNEIKELVKLLDESSLTWLELELDGSRILLKKEKQLTAAGKQEVPVSVPAAASAVQAEEPDPVQPAAKYREDLITVSSPIVGTFYSAASPEAEPFVEENSKVKKGDPLCIIEAMKLMNEIEAEQDLEIVEILITNGEMVEYGQPLFLARSI